MPSTAESLAQIKKTLEKITGLQKMQTFTPEGFIAYAHDQVKKAQAEGEPGCTRRLKALRDAVTLAKDNWTDTESESIKVPIYVEEQTTLKDQSNTLQTPDKVAAMNSGGESVFEDGFVAKAANISKSLTELAKSLTEKAGDDETEEDKAKKAAEDTEEGDDTTKGGGKKKFEQDETNGGASEDEQGKKKAAKSSGKVDKVAKGFTDETGTFWPNNLNVPGGKVEKGAVDDSWGADPKG